MSTDEINHLIALGHTLATPADETAGTFSDKETTPAKLAAQIAADKEKATHAVIYTDGGCQTGLRIGGWGIHGYLFYEGEAKQGTGCSKALPTPKGYQMNAGGKPSMILTQYVDGFGTLMPDSTNNRAEVMGAIRAMEVALEQKLKHLLLIMDSKYAMQGLLEWLPGWEAKNFIKQDFTEVSNIDLWKQASTLKKQLALAGIALEARWVKGHSGDLGNDLADANATRGVAAGMNGKVVEETKYTDAKGYWNVKTERSRMFSHPNWFFGTQGEDQGISDDGRFVYYLGDPREDDELLGKKIADATFSVLYLKECEPTLQLIRESVTAMGMGQYQGLSIGRLDKIFNPDIYQEIAAYGDTLLVKDYQRQRVSTTNDVLLTKEIRPARLAYSAVDALQSLEQLLKEYLKPLPNTLVRTTDLTGLMYESDTSKKKPVFKLKSHITSALRSITVDGNYATGSVDAGVSKFTLTFGLDLPDRNTLSALAGEGIKATLLTWPESPRAIRYATVIEADGDVGIWSGIYANLHMLAS